MRLAHGDMRDHVVWYKNGYGASYRRCGVLRWRSRLKSAFAGFSALFDFRLLQQNPHQSGRPPAARAYGFTPWFQSVSREEDASKCDAQFLISPGEIGRDQKGNGRMCPVCRDFLVTRRAQTALAELR